MEKVIVVGLGYVGLPLALEAAKSGFEVIGIDSNLKKVEIINSGIPLVEDVLESDLKKLLKSKKFIASSDFSKIKDSQIIIFCVPTPISLEKEPDLSFLKSAISSVAKFLKSGCLIIFESTVAPGTTRNHLIPLLLSESGMNSEDIHFVFSPERIDPTNGKWNLKNTPKLISGSNKTGVRAATNFYSKFVDNVVECESIEIAECAKLLENSFRFINISFINDFAIFCNRFGVDVTKVIEAANTKPYGFMQFYPSIGVGGHCIPVDSIYLSDMARKIGSPIRMIDLAAEINDEMPKYVVTKAEEKLINLKNKKILVIGVSYKPNVGDVRESPVMELIKELREKGAEVFWHDNLVKVWNGEESVEIGTSYDLAILATPHGYIDMKNLGNVPIINTRGAMF
jgi:UDP-N-acetyl-D-glucosamine dehydrogenase